MNISYNWLRDIIDLNLSVEETAAALTRVGLAVEGIHPHGEDFVLDVDLTSNRSDCLSHRGIARELGVSTGNRLKDSDIRPLPESGSNLVRIEEPELCNRFTARVLRGVKVEPSPKWLVDRLEAIGERPINNVADITNYVMHEIGQPMHSFDLDKLAGGRLIVRRASIGETIRTLDDVERKLDPSMLAIYDAEKPVAIGGVMGGLDSSITDSTVNVLLEVAYFNRSNIRATSRRLNLATEASYRFERGTDVMNLLRASERAADLICELAGASKHELVDIFPVQSEPKHIPAPDIAGSVKRLTGLKVEEGDCKRILSALGITVTSEGVYESPSWRHDISIEEDLVEEIARHAGYENIADELPPAYGAGEYQPTEMKERRLRSRLADMGFDEALSYSFIDTRHDELFDLVPGLIDEKVDDRFVTLRDSVIEGAVRMRPTILPGLLDAIRLNMNHQRRDLKLFEVGKVFAAASGEDGLPNEQKALAIAVSGGVIEEGRDIPVRPLDFYDAKGAVEAALEAAGISGSVFIAREIKHLRPGQSAVIRIDNREIGTMGRLSDEVASGYKFKQVVYVAEINMSRALSAPRESAIYRPLAKFPSIIRDVSFVVDRKFELKVILDAIVQGQVDLCRKAAFVDVYEGKGLAENERSITIRFEYRSDERTLVDEEVEVLHQGILDRLATTLGISVRS